jgi:hypothetical protein
VEFFGLNQNPPSAASLVVSICTNPDGTGLLGQSNLITLDDQWSGHTASLNATLQPFVDYYLIFTRVLGVPMIGATDNLYEWGDYATTFTPQAYVDGSPINWAPIWLRLGYQGPPTQTTATVDKTGYTVLQVKNGVLTEGTPLGIDGTDTFGNCVTAPDAMVRVPGLNRFWAWRNYPSSGLAALDCLQVTGSKVARLGSAVVVPAGYAHPYTPHQIVPINSTEALTVLSLPNRLVLVHAVYAGGTVTTTTQDIYNPPADGITMVPGLTNQAELFTGVAGADPLTLVRIGIDWRAGAFAVTSLPITQIPTGTKPDGYSPRSKTAALSIITGSVALAHDGNLVIARQYHDNGSDDNWILFTQYDQTTGNIVASTWAKGDCNGGKTDYLVVTHPALRLDYSTSRLIFADVEPYTPGGVSGSQIGPPRLGVYRFSYVMDGNLRSQRERFER